MFSWDAPKALRNYEKHGVPFEEAATVFSDPDGLDWPGLRRFAARANGAPLEETWRSSQGRVLLVVYTLRRLAHGTETIRLISARQASRKERKAYAG